LDPDMERCEIFKMESWFNTIAFGSRNGGHQADFTGTGDLFLSEDTASDRIIQVGAMQLLFPETNAFKRDNISCCGQKIPVDLEIPDVSFLTILGCGEWGSPSENFIIYYEDSDSEVISIKVTDWTASTPMYNEKAAYSGRFAKQHNGVVQILN